MTYTSAECTVETPDDGQRNCPKHVEFLDGSFQSRPGWSWLKAVIKPVWHIPVPNVQWKTPDGGKRNCPKHVDFPDKNNFGKISASVGFIKKKFITMHSHMNVKSLVSWLGSLENFMLKFYFLLTRVIEKDRPWNSLCFLSVNTMTLKWMLFEWGYFEINWRLNL